MNIIWTPVAEYQRAAGRMNTLFASVAGSLSISPERGKPGHLPGTCELFAHQNYRLIYKVDEQAHTIWILARVHGAQQWPPAPE